MLRRMPSIAFASVVVALAFGMAVAQEGQKEATVELSDPSKQNLEAGHAVAVGAYTIGHTPQPQIGACFQCHGMDGRGDGAAVFPRLSDQVYKYLYDALEDYASGVRQSAIMGPIAEALTVEQIRDVSAYYAAQRVAPYPPRPEVDPEVLQLGGALAAAGSAGSGVQACMNCHGPDGIGLSPTYPYLAGQYALYLESQLMAWKNGTRKGDGFGIMEEIAKRLSEEEIRAVSLYYASLRPASVTPEMDETSAPMVPMPDAAIPEPGR